MFRTTIGWVLCALAGCATTASEVASEERWVEVRTPHFVAWTAGERDQAVALLRDLERFHQVLLVNTSASERPAAPPLRIFMAPDGASFSALIQGRRGNVRGIVKSSARGMYAIVDNSFARLDEDSEDLRRTILFHEHVHYIQALAGAKIPSWYNEGFAEYMATTRFDEDGSYTVGCPPLYRTRYARYVEWVPTRELMSAEPINRLNNKNRDSYLEAWYVVHYLSVDRARAAQRSRYLELWAQGVEHEEAFARAFDTNEAAFDQAVRDYSAHSKFDCVKVTPARPLSPPAVEVRPLSQAEARLYVGELLLNVSGATAEAIELLEASARGAREDARPLAALSRAHLALATGDEATDAAAELERASKYLAQATLLASGDPAVATVEGEVRSARAARLMQSDRTAGLAELKEARRAFRRAIRQREDLAEAYVGLGRTYLIDDNGSAEADTVLEAAAFLLPLNLDIPLALAALRLGRDQLDEAVAPLKYARIYAEDPELQAKVTEMLVSISAAQSSRSGRSNAGGSGVKHAD